MSSSSLDLTGLDKFSSLLKDPKAAAAAAGKPLDLPLDAIDEDPDQPRKSFGADALEELAESIRARGVKQPISVRPAEQDGRYIINHGARRFRASRLAERETIPAFVDADHGEIDQLAENIQRENLNTREIIDGIGQLLARGKSNAQIAKELGKSKAWVSKYTKLQGMSSVLTEALATGRCKDADALGILQRCVELDESAVVRVLGTGEGLVTKLDADRLRNQLEHAKAIEQAEPEVGSESEMAGADDSAVAGVHDMNTTTGTADGGAVEAGQALTASPENERLPAKVDGDGGKENITVNEGNAGGGDDKAGQGADRKQPLPKVGPPKNKKPQVQVKVGRREAILLLDKPCEYGLAWVEFEDGSEELTDANRLKLVAVTDGKKG